jgi:hypothetical protein
MQADPTVIENVGHHNGNAKNKTSALAGKWV